MKKPKPKKPKKPKPKKPKPKKPKKPKQPKKPKKPKGPGKPDPDKPEKKPGKKPQKPLKPKLRLSRIPAACKPFVGSPQLLDCWLGHNPKVAEAIVWEPTPNSFLAWPAWTNAMKAQLRQAWLDARAWHANGLTGFTGTFVEDPPPNQDLPGDSGWLRTVLDGPTQWWPLYLAHVAHCLAAEIGGWFAWSLRDCEPEMLEQLLSAVQMFRRDTDDGGAWDSDYPGGYVLGGMQSLEKVTPSHPTFTYAFLKENNLVAPTATATIGRVLNWCRWNLAHYLGAFTAQNADYHWQYLGAPPMRRIIEGTKLLDPQWVNTFPDPEHWTAGCGGTSAFLRSLLRAVNIPVHPRVSGGGHMVPHFMAQNLYLSHGDDPYSSFAKTSYPADLLLLDEATFKSWFPLDPPNDPQDPVNQATALKNVGRRVIDLAVWHLSDQLLFYYCQDKFNGLDHASGQVFAVFDAHYTVAQLEATNLWERLEAAAAAAGKC